MLLPFYNYLPFLHNTALEKDKEKINEIIQDVIKEKQKMLKNETGEVFYFQTNYFLPNSAFFKIEISDCKYL